MARIDTGPSAGPRPHAADADVAQRVLGAAAYVEDHIHEPITVREMADAACYSLFHFCRVFNAVAWFSPYDYAMRRRLTAASSEIVGSDRPITEIAFDTGFESTDGFARAFRRMFGTSPSQARADGSVDRRRLLAPLDQRGIDVLAACRATGNCTRTSDTGLIARAATGRSGAEAMREALHDRLPGDDWVGCFDDGRTPAHVQAFAGAQTDTPVRPTASHPFTVTVPAGDYFSLTFTGPADLLPLLPGLVCSTLWPRLGTPEPPGSIYVNLGEEHNLVLVPVEG